MNLQPSRYDRAHPQSQPQIKKKLQKNQQNQKHQPVPPAHLRLIEETPGCVGPETSGLQGHGQGIRISDGRDEHGNGQRYELADPCEQVLCLQIQSP